MFGGGGRTVSIMSLFLSYLKWNKMKVNGELERDCCFGGRSILPPGVGMEYSTDVQYTKFCAPGCVNFVPPVP